MSNDTLVIPPVPFKKNLQYLIMSVVFAGLAIIFVYILFQLREEQVVYRSFELVDNVSVQDIFLDEKQNLFAKSYIQESLDSVIFPVNKKAYEAYLNKTTIQIYRDQEGYWQVFNAPSAMVGNIMGISGIFLFLLCSFYMLQIYLKPYLQRKEVLRAPMKCLGKVLLHQERESKSSREGVTNTYHLHFQFFNEKSGRLYKYEIWGLYPYLNPNTREWLVQGDEFYFYAASNDQTFHFLPEVL